MSYDLERHSLLKFANASETDVSWDNWDKSPLSLPHIHMKHDTMERQVKRAALPFSAQ